MKILLIGATGRIGSNLLTLLSKQNHTIYAAARSPSKIQSSYTTIKCDVSLKEDIATVLNLSLDVVILTLGPSKDSPDDLFQQAVTNLLEVRKQQKDPFKRVIVLGGAVYKDPKDKASIPFKWKLLSYISYFVGYHKVFKDGELNYIKKQI